MTNQYVNHNLETAKASPERVFLDAALNFLIPAAPTKNLPSGSEVFDKIAFFQSPQTWFADGFVKSNDECKNLHSKDFVSLSSEQQQEVLQSLQKKLSVFNTNLMRLLSEQYYQNGQVLEAIGYGNRPPFPEGHEIPEGDLTLLEDVYYNRGQVYRNV